MNRKEENIIGKIKNKIGKETILFFDLDGTIVETDYSNFLAYNKAINLIFKKNISYNSSERFTREKLLSIFPNLTKALTNNIIEKKEVFYKDYLVETKLNRTIYNTLIKYHKTNRTFLVTNSRKDRALMILHHYNLEEKFEKIFYRQLNKNKKVNKFKNTISYLNIFPENIVVFENEQSEIIDAINAGIPKENIIKINSL